MKFARTTFAAGAAVLALAAPAAAHHSYAMFDSTKMFVWDAQVVQFDWRNPHCHIIIKVPPGAKDPRTVGTWDIEGVAVNIMIRQGWTKTSLKPGDKVTIVGQPDRQGGKTGALYYALVKGKKLYVDVDRNGGPGAQGRGPPADVVLP